MGNIISYKEIISLAVTCNGMQHLRQLASVNVTWLQFSIID